MGEFFTRKVGPLPVWAWAAVALVAVYLYRRSTSSSTTASTTASTGVTPPTETITTAGGTYSGPVNAAPSSITNPTTPSPGNTGTTTVSPGNTGVAAFTPPSTASLSGSGYWESSGPGSGQIPITDQSGAAYTWIASPAQLPILEGAQNTYVQSAPGVFTPVNIPQQGSGLAAGTPIYQKTG